MIVRMGAEKLRDKFPALIDAVRDAGQTVAWITDPMHGNTETCNSYKTRRCPRVIKFDFVVSVECCCCMQL